MLTHEKRFVSTSALDTGRCWELLDTHVVGRVGFTSGGEQVILPVNYVVDEGGVLICTGRTDFDFLPNGAPVVLEIDDTDGLSETGWSVLVKGRATEVTGTNERFAVGTEPHTHVIRITPRSVTGRAINHGTSPEGHFLPYMPPD